MKSSIEKRLGKLEEKRKPKRIETWVDLMMFCESDADKEDVEWGPGWQELFDEACKIQKDHDN
jgi:hypothetical protein